MDKWKMQWKGWLRKAGMLALCIAVSSCREREREPDDPFVGLHEQVRGHCKANLLIEKLTKSHYRLSLFGPEYLMSLGSVLLGQRVGDAIVNKPLGHEFRITIKNKAVVVARPDEEPCHFRRVSEQVQQPKAENSPPGKKPTHPEE